MDDMAKVTAGVFGWPLILLLATFTAIALLNL